MADRAGWQRLARQGAAGALCWLGASVQAADLTLHINNVQSAEHHVIVAIFRGGQGFPDPAAAGQRVRLAADPPAIRARVTDLAPGRYAVIAYHDEDGDGELDRFLGTFPTEGVGLSRNPQLSGPPAFADSAFKLGETGAALEIRLRY
jgi:uncharacterized protein (DUF2141 family)